MENMIIMKIAMIIYGLNSLNIKKIKITKRIYSIKTMIEKI